MGVINYTQEFKTAVPASRMFNAMILDSHNFLPKLLPQAFKSIEISGGDGGVGSIKITNFAEGAHLKFLKNRIDALDKENYVCKHTLIEGDVIGDKVSSIVYQISFVSSGDGGCICKTTSEYHTVDGIEIKEEEIKAGKEKALGMYKAVEAYLLANPDVYA